LIGSELCGRTGRSTTTATFWRAAGRREGWLEFAGLREEEIHGKGGRRGMAALATGSHRLDELGLATCGHPRWRSFKLEEERGRESWGLVWFGSEREEVCVGMRIDSGACSRRQGGSGRAGARQKAVSLDARWPARAAHGTRGPRQLDGSGLRQRAPSSGAGSMARGQGKAMVGRLTGRTPAPCPPGVRWTLRCGGCTRLLYDYAVEVLV
jgi:hypothetical protein